MTDTTAPAPESVALADRADRMLELLRARGPAEADAQASAIVMAGLTMLQDVRGTAAVLAVLDKVGPAMTQRDTTAPEMTADPVSAPFSPIPENLASVALGHLRVLPLDLGQAQARAAITASAAYLRETAGVAATLDTLAGVTDAVRDAGQAVVSPEPEPRRPDPDALALSLLDTLRGTAPDQAHEQAQAAIVGAAAYLVEARGPTYTAAVVDGLLTNARRHIETWGASPRPDGAPLH